MREILFRGKDQYNDWIYGYLCQYRGDSIADNGGDLLDDSDYYIRDWTEKIDTDLYGCNYKVRPSTVSQYTGLTDKDGRKIFEGDIIHVKDLIRCPVGFGNCLCIADYIASVAFDNCRFCLSKVNGGIYEIPLDSEKIEVIGNIHDNPELLEADE